MRVLISTIKPIDGGVPISLKFAIDSLKRRDWDITLAYYEPFSLSPSLSVPFYKLPALRKPGRTQSSYLDCKAFGIGCWLPELEFTHNWPTKHWRELIDAHQLHLTVSGSALASLPFQRTGVPFLSWIASDWDGDREHRVKQFPLLRRLIDRSVVAPITRKLEKDILNTNSVVGISQYTKKVLNQVAGAEVVTDVQSIAIDTNTFCPLETKSESETFDIGFTGRFEDERKNLNGLLRAFTKLLDKHPRARLVLMGGEASSVTRRKVKELGIEKSILFLGLLPRDEMILSLKKLDLFVVPSFQEGLCISALEAMSCAIPVVSTRCGGPESFIRDGENGILCDVEDQSIADALSDCIEDIDKRELLSKNGRATVLEEFSVETQQTRFLSLIDRHFSL